MKKLFISAIVVMCVIFSLCSCGKAPQALPSPEPTSAPVSEPTPEPTPEPAESAAPVEEPEPTPEQPAFDEEKYNAALALKGEDVALLYEAIGEPLEAEYVPSCMTDQDGNGEDGWLTYEGFSVATYRNGEKEIVWDVIIDAA